jgi:hypothetical protein
MSVHYIYMAGAGLVVCCQFTKCHLAAAAAAVLQYYAYNALSICF